MSQETPRTVPLPLETRKRIEALIEQVGESEARRLTSLSRTAFARALAGLPVYPGTAALIAAALSHGAQP